MEELNCIFQKDKHELVKGYSNYPNYAYLREYYKAIEEIARKNAERGKHEVLGRLSIFTGGKALLVAKDKKIKKIVENEQEIKKKESR